MTAVWPVAAAAAFINTCAACHDLILLLHNTNRPAECFKDNHVFCQLQAKVRNLMDISCPVMTWRCCYRCHYHCNCRCCCLTFVPEFLKTTGHISPAQTYAQASHQTRRAAAAAAALLLLLLTLCVFCPM
jgi:hypothetical protein